ncbi:GNAT family N-acetyltransferase [Nitratireductor sp. XY-223]|uniref:GNAT family N-acetyltransferase n=1 Tax=Nitratireductor sp. XY-223 TaxID=2561926 RepID=UPI00145B6BE1|nr:GNAT family N-acetyltransferase [Nitratireductor sp. XY-223]
MKPILPLESGRLRPATADDACKVLALLRSPSVRWFLCDGRTLARSEVDAMLADSIELDADGLGLWIIEDHTRGFAGLMGLAPVSPQASVSDEMTGGIEPTIAIAPEHEGTGLAFDALKAILAYARSFLELRRLVAAVDEPNRRSHRLLKRVGFEITGRACGPAHELVLYALSFDDAPDGA